MHPSIKAFLRTVTAHVVFPAAERVSRTSAPRIFRFMESADMWHSYQPAPWFGIHDSARAEATLARWSVIERELAGIPPGSAMDLGAQSGFFTFKLAEAGFLTLGVEDDIDCIRAMRLIKKGARLDLAAINHARITSANVAALPVVDVTIFLSLWHHMCRAEGFEAAKQILRTVLAKTRHVCFFETGQSDESYMGWAPALPRMEPTAQQWITQLLQECGAKTVRHLGAFETHLGPVPRHMFAALMQG